MDYEIYKFNEILQLYNTDDDGNLIFIANDKIINLYNDGLLNPKAYKINYDLQEIRIYQEK